MNRMMARLRLALGACLALTVGGNAMAQSRRTLPPGYYGLPTPERGEEALRQAMLEGHNDERRALGLAPLVWDEGLVAEAGRYAADMARSGVFAHSRQDGRVRIEGENLWMGSRGFFAYDQMVGTFLDERRYFNASASLPNISSTGRWQDVGHYTQMIWRGTKSVGCALAEGPSDDFLVCRYWPAGNVFGQGPLDQVDKATRIVRR